MLSRPGLHLSIDKGREGLETEVTSNNHPCCPVLFEAVYYNVERKSRLETVERQTIVLLSVQ